MEFRWKPRTVKMPPTKKRSKSGTGLSPRPSTQPNWPFRRRTNCQKSGKYQRVRPMTRQNSFCEPRKEAASSAERVVNWPLVGKRRLLRVSQDSVPRS
jgi:hypothetical protein